jgi:hypothetical protein
MDSGQARTFKGHAGKDQQIGHAGKDQQIGHAGAGARRSP